MRLRKLFKPIGLGGASALIAFTSFLSYAVGLVRDRTIAVHFGTTAATDTYNASFLIPDVLFNLFIAGALVAAFMPIFSEYLYKNKKEAFVIANTMLSGASLLIAFLIVIAFIFMEQIIPGIFPGVGLAEQKDIIFMTKLMLPSAFIFAISNTLGNILMTYRHFLSFALSPVLYNLGIILGILLLNDSLGIYSAAIGVLIGASLHLTVRLIDVFYTGFKYKPELKIKHPGFKKIIKLMIPKSLSLIAWQVNLYIFAVVGMRMAEGGLASFNFARNIQSFAVSLFGIAFATAVFPSLNAAISQNNRPLFTKNIQSTIQRILFFTVPAAVGIILLAEPITNIILGGGEFGKKSLEMTSIILLFFAISIPFESLSHLFARSFYAMRNTVTPMLINIFSLTVIALITIFVAPNFGIKWFSIGFTIGFVIYNVLFVSLLSRHLKGFLFPEFFKSLFKTALSATIMGVVVYFSKDLDIHINLPEKLFQASRIAMGGASYLIVAYILKSPELNSVQFLLKKLLKKGNA